MRTLGAVVLGLMVAAACGGKKTGTTTPSGNGSAAGSADPSMTDSGDPANPGAGGAGGTGPVGTGPTGGGPNIDGPTVVPPNLDPDPATVKSQVDAQLTIAKGALAQPTPDADGALRAARSALALDAANVDAAAYVAFAYYHKRLYDTAELVLDDLFKREAAKRNANVFYVYGLVYDRTNRPERAALAYKTATELDGKHASALVNLGVHQLKNSQYAEAQSTFERLTKEFGRNDAITLTSLGSAYRGRSADYPQGAPERDQFVRTAEAAYKRALQANASYGHAYYNLGLLYLDTDPFPGLADTMLRLNAAKSFFDQYKNMPGVDINLYQSRTKDVDKAIKRAQKQLKQKKPPKKP
jgi:tetratricopeptide (TPR) repeat protein